MNHIKSLAKVGLDAVIFGFALVLAYWIRFDGPPRDPAFLHQLKVILGLLIALRVLSNYGLGVYRQVWAYLGLNDLIILIAAALIPSIILALGRVFLTVEHQLWRVPYGVILSDFLLATGGTVGIRTLRRIWFERSSSRKPKPRSAPRSSKVRVLLAGAGMAGITVAREAKRGRELNWKLVGFVDDDSKKLGTTIHGIRVIGTTVDIPVLVREHAIDRVIITISNTSSKNIRKIVEICESVPVPVKIVPGMFEILDDKVSISKLRDVRIDDLLGREVVNFDDYAKSVGHYFHAKRILITGAGGSIGSEICRQLCSFGPTELQLLDKDENGLYEIVNELEFSHPHVSRITAICDIRSTTRLSTFLNRYKPQIIFHAAAHKHVPLMEDNVREAVTNNVQGTLNLINLADQIGCENFVMLSTDKAVNPTSIMGATKRIAELMIQSYAGKSTRFSGVRFGNVLGSKGSVVPLFQSQIMRGGPITVTDKSITRFFMTIPEAVQLVIQAATLGSKGEIYVLDMGSPVRIVDLAQDLIKLSGLDEDAIEITYTGLRPGEKLHEELFYPFEKASTTDYPKIVSIAPANIDFQRFWERLNGFLGHCDSLERKILRQRLFDLISDCVPAADTSEQMKPLRAVQKFGGQIV